MQSHPLIVVAGPTASRKSELAVGLATRLSGELVCCDSIQLVHGFRIGAAGPTDEQLARVPHHLFGVMDPLDPTDAGKYTRLADQAISEIRERGNLPIVVGGTGLYLRALTEGLVSIPRIAAAHRERLQKELKSVGPEKLFERLQELDGPLAARIEGGARNTQRVLRGLEVVEGTGVRLSDLHDGHRKQEPRYACEILMPWFDTHTLNERIARRVEQMMTMGFLEEVRELLRQGVPASCRPMQSLGYRELIRSLDGLCSLEQAVEDIKKGHRRYAKRQRTWFRNQANGIQLDGDAVDLVSQACARLVQK